MRGTHGIKFHMIAWYALLAMFGFVSGYSVFKPADLLPLALPFALVASIYSVKEVIAGVTAGTFLTSLQAALTRLAWALFLYFFALGFVVGSAPEVTQFGWGLYVPFTRFAFLSLLLLAGYELLEFPARRHPAFKVALKSSAILAAAFLWKEIVAGYGIEFVDVVFPLLLLASIGVALSSISLHPSPRLRIAGKIVVPTLALVGAGLFYFMCFRERLMGPLGHNFPIFEWGIVSGMIGSVVLALGFNVRRMSERPRFAEWAKHRHIVGVCTEAELEAVARLAEDFVGGGDRSGIVGYLVSLAIRNGVEPAAAARGLKELLKYKDVEFPWLTSRKVAMALHAKNQERRMRVVKEAIRRTEETVLAPEGVSP